MWRKRLCPGVHRLIPGSDFIRGRATVVVFIGVGLWMAGCDSVETTGPLAEYEGHRALEILQVTQNFTPSVQWLGGRVAAVGVNRGDEAALDSTLIWISTADGNEIASHVVVDGDANEAGLVQSFGGSPADSLESGEQYTFWLAEEVVFDAGLDSAAFDGMNYVDTTFTMELVLRGNTRGAAGAGIFGTPLIDEIRIIREQSLLENRYKITWEPSDVVFRRIAIRQGSTGGFDNLIWHIVVPDSVEQGLAPPVAIGQAPEHAQVPIEFSGFSVPDVYALWMVTEDWNDGFGPSNEGYVDFQMFCDNFTDDPVNDC